MTDVRIVTSFNYTGDMPIITMDWLLTPMGTLDETEELATAFKVALATDGLADPDDILPGLEDDTDRKGWWADYQAAQIWNGWPIGSRLWLLKRASITDAAFRKGATIARAEQYAKEALQPFIDNHICSAIDVVATRTSKQTIVITVHAFRGPLPEIELQYQVLWADIER